MAMSATEPAWSVVVPHHPRGAGQARTHMAARLSSLVRPELLTDALAVAAELVGNAVRHANALPGDVIRVTWQVRFVAGAETVAVRVTDGGAATAPSVRRADSDAVDGRGLSIVAALADDWGVETDGAGQSVWADISWPSARRTTTGLAVGD